MRLFAVLFSCLLASSGLFAASPPTETCCPSNNRLFLGAEWSWQWEDLAEQTPSGNLWGIAFDFDYLAPSQWYLGASFSWATGDLKNGVERDRDDLIDAQGRMGYTFCRAIYGKNVMAALYSGFGYRELDTTIEAQQNFRNKYTRLYVPIGVRVEACCYSPLSIGLDVEGRIDVLTQEWANSTSTGVELDRRAGAAIDIPITYRFCPTSRYGFNIRLVPFFKWDGYGQPKSINQPNLRFDLYDAGLRLQAGYRW